MSEWKPPASESISARTSLASCEAKLSKASFTNSGDLASSLDVNANQQ